MESPLATMKRRNAKRAAKCFAVIAKTWNGVAGATKIFVPIITDWWIALLAKCDTVEPVKVASTVSCAVHLAMKLVFVLQPSDASSHNCLFLPMASLDMMSLASVTIV